MTHPKRYRTFAQFMRYFQTHNKCRPAEKSAFEIWRLNDDIYSEEEDKFIKSVHRLYKEKRLVNLRRQLSVVFSMETFLKAYTEILLNSETQPNEDTALIEFLEGYQFIIPEVHPSYTACMIHREQ